MSAPSGPLASVPELEERGSELVDALRTARVPVIVWGHPLGTHTHSWIHYGFARAFERLGFEVLWLDDSEQSARRVAGFERAIVLTETQQDRHLVGSVKPSWLVFGHNTERERYPDPGLYVHLQVLMLDKSGYRNPRWHPEVDSPASEEEPATNPPAAAAPQAEILWATDLLPDEITFTPHRDDTRDVVFVGSVWSYNRSTIKAVRRAVRASGLRWRAHRNVDQARHAELIRGARFAPSVQGDWQVDHGYIPCRLFKNVSYSQLAVSNNSSARLVLDEDQLVFEREPPALVEEMLRVEGSGRLDEMVRSAQATVSERHTYLNRIHELLGFADDAYPELIAILTGRPQPKPGFAA